MIQNAFVAALLMLIQFVFKYFADFLSPAKLKRLADAALDFVEDAVKKSRTKLDDVIVLELCEAIRNAFDIPDEDVESRIKAVRASLKE